MKSCLTNMSHLKKLNRDEGTFLGMDGQYKFLDDAFLNEKNLFVRECYETLWKMIKSPPSELQPVESGSESASSSTEIESYPFMILGNPGETEPASCEHEFCFCMLESFLSFSQKESERATFVSTSCGISCRKASRSSTGWCYAHLYMSAFSLES